MIRSTAEIYKVLEKHLRKAGDNPQTCVDLYEHRDVQELVESANRVSDYLGHMWRRGVLQRYYAANTTQRSRYAYTWIGDRADLTAADARALRAIDSVGSNPAAATREDRETADAADYDAICNRCSAISGTDGSCGMVDWHDLPESWQDGSALGPISPL